MPATVVCSVPVSSYLTVARDGSVETEVRRSRFLCTVVRVADETGARGVVDQQRKQHWNARHHVLGVRARARADGRAGHDDGEPPGTGGPPVLEVVRGRALSDVVVVVSRVFGGMLLGTGGLSRAYADAVRAVLDEVGTVERVLQDLCDVTVDLAAVGRLEHELRSRGARVLRIDYTDVATLGSRSRRSRSRWPRRSWPS